MPTYILISNCVYLKYEFMGYTYDIPIYIDVGYTYLPYIIKKRETQFYHIIIICRYYIFTGEGKKNLYIRRRNKKKKEIHLI